LIQKRAAGQSTQPPAEKVFGSHYIVHSGNTYYDPSYGVTYTNELDFEAKAVVGYWKFFLGDPTSPHLVIRVKSSQNLNEIRFFP